MVDNFDEFARKREQEQQDRERLAKDTAPEWSMLKSFTESLAVDGKGIDRDKFQWVPDANEPRLVIGAVAATFLHRQRGGQLTELCIRFDRRPPGLNKVWSDEESPLEPVLWSLEPTVVGDSTHWTITNVGTTKPRFSSAELSQEIGIKLAEFHLAYNKHYESWGTAT